VIEVTTGGHWPGEVRRILDGLPMWFGMPESNEEYVEKASTLTNVVARDGGDVVGICLLQEHNPRSVEIDLIAVPEPMHRRGIGRMILEHVERELVAGGVRMLHVKTYGPSGSSVEYERTREFYEGTGFVPLEERTDIWGEQNPCLILVKPLA
jgi:N-acetylglutamate synthase-like GNAT family acetyltransferase